MSLDDEIRKGSKEVSTDSYSMSVGELIYLYKDAELNVHPQFQRFFRWTSGQKSRFVESLLLGIPVPSIFVSQNERGKWDVVDGNQRLSTILELVGELKDEGGERKPPLVLENTRYLGTLEGKRWASASPDEELSELAKLKIKRARLDMNIVLNTSDPHAKYELFRRLNTGGTFAEPQEVRNCLVIMRNPEFFNWMCELSKDENFRICLPLTERRTGEQFDLELLARFLVLRCASEKALNRIRELSKFLDEEIMAMAQAETYDMMREKEAFQKTFGLLAGTLGEDVFKKFDPVKRRALGPPLVSLFEVIATGIGHHCLKPDFSVTSEKIRDVHETLWQNQAFLNHSGSRASAASRIPVTVRLGRRLFST